MSNLVEWGPGWRDEIWSQLDEDWDLIVVGGGITGAGILREAVRAGYKTLLVEAQDFSAGTSSRSSKLVHGGFRYMANGQFRLTFESVHEREKLLADGKGLITKLDILIPDFPSNKVPGWALGFGLGIYSVMAGKFSFRHLNRKQLSDLCSGLCREDLRGGFKYYDANTDDARLTLRVIREAVCEGGAALNYARATNLLRDLKGKVCGIVLEDQARTRSSKELNAPLVINATGAWADDLRGKIGKDARIRPLQGSHLILPFERLPISESVSIFHPRDGRPVFTLPWEGVTLVGTTDLDAGHSIHDNPIIQESEIAYLFEFLQFAFPELEIQEKDVQCTMAGIRPVINTGKTDPSKESREHALWLEDNFLTVTGGKLTTFRLMARDVMRVAIKVLGRGRLSTRNQPIFHTNDTVELQTDDLDVEGISRLFGRYGLDSVDIMNNALPGELGRIESTAYRWSELRWASRMEGVVHLDDLLLRRVRLGLLLPEGGRSVLPKVRQIAQPELGWSDRQWEEEESRYLNIWDTAYKLRSA